MEIIQELELMVMRDRNKSIDSGIYTLPGLHVAEES